MIEALRLLGAMVGALAIAWAFTTPGDQFMVAGFGAVVIVFVVVSILITED